MTALAGASPPHPVFKSTVQRRQIRQAWGRRAGIAAFQRGVPFSQNAFEPLPGTRMPMYESWNQGWRDAARS